MFARAVSIAMDNFLNDADVVEKTLYQPPFAMRAAKQLEKAALC
jgi:hypothetical protein